MEPTTATNARIQEFLSQYRDWSTKNGKLHREYIFNNFVQAFSFMIEAALIAESSHHHPEWFNVYSKVIVDLITHEMGGITERDFYLAKRMEKIAVTKIV